MHIQVRYGNLSQDSIHEKYALFVQKLNITLFTNSDYLQFPKIHISISTSVIFWCFSSTIHIHFAENHSK